MEFTKEVNNFGVFGSVLVVNNDVFERNLCSRWTFS